MKLRVSFPSATGNHTTKIKVIKDKKGRFIKNRFYTLPKIKAYRNAVLCDIIAAGRRPCDKIGYTMAVKVKIVPPDRRRRDSGNIIKVLYDALTRAGFWADDCLVRHETIEWGEPEKVPYIELEVSDALSVSTSANA